MRTRRRQGYGGRDADPVSSSTSARRGRARAVRSACGVSDGTAASVPRRAPQSPETPSICPGLTPKNPRFASS